MLCSGSGSSFKRVESQLSPVLQHLLHWTLQSFALLEEDRPLQLNYTTDH
jgi:histidine ammonia-lyase